MRKSALLYNLFAWAAVYVLWIAVFQNRSFTLTRTLTVEFCYMLFIAADFYTIVYYLIPQVLDKRGYVPFVGSAFVLLFISSLLRARLALFMNNAIFLKGTPQIPFLDLVATSM